jgi:hypothetical protein
MSNLKKYLGAIALIVSVLGCSSISRNSDQRIQPYIDTITLTTHEWIVCWPYDHSQVPRVRLRFVSVVNANAMCAKQIGKLPVGTPIKLLSVREDAGLGAAGLFHYYGEFNFPERGLTEAALVLTGVRMPPW